ELTRAPRDDNRSPTLAGISLTSTTDCPSRSPFRSSGITALSHQGRPGSIRPESREREKMLSYAHGACDEALLGETIGENLERTIARVPDAEALVCRHQDIRCTYSEFGERVDRLASGMLEAGLGKGDRVAVHGGQISGVHPAPAVDRLVGALAVVPVTAHHQVAAGAEFARFAAGLDPAV